MSTASPDLVAPWPPTPLTAGGVTLRASRAHDRTAYIDLLASADAQRHLGGVRDRAALEEGVPTVPGDRPGSFVVEAEGRFAGVVQLTRRADGRPGTFPGGRAGRRHDLELGYTLVPAFWGRGIGTTAARLALDWAGEALDDTVVLLSTQVADTASVRLARRLGFVEVDRFEEFGAQQWFGAAPLRRDERVVMVAAYADNRVIGDRGDIPWRIGEDFAHFKRVTLGQTLVMGRATWDSIGRPLPGRETVVVTRDPGWRAPGHEDVVRVAHSVQEALAVAARLPGDTVIAGGSQVYVAAMPWATHQVLTEVHLSPPGDARYPELDPTRWVETAREPRPDLGLEWVWWERVSRRG